MSTDMVVLPTSAAPAGWTPQQQKLMIFAGIAREITTNGVKTTIVPDPGVAEAFLLVCKRTGLDPFAKQIYAMEVSGRMSIVVGIDGFRIVAQRSAGYEGQVGPQWWTGRMTDQPLVVNGRAVLNDDGQLVYTRQQEWVDAWVPAAFDLPEDAKPVAARVGVWRKGFREPLWQVVTWKEFGVEPRFRGDNWGVRPAHMLGIRAETHALRRAFPNDLSGLYTQEDFDADSGELNEDIEHDIKRIEGITDLNELTRFYQELHAIGMPDKVREAFMKRAGDLGAPPRSKPPREDDEPHPDIRKRITPEPQPEGVDEGYDEPPPQHRPAKGQPTQTTRQRTHVPTPEEDPDAMWTAGGPRRPDLTEEEWEAQQAALADQEMES